MMHSNHSAIRSLLVATLGSLLFTISGHAAETQGSKRPPAASDRPAATSMFEACAFIPRTELESLIGRELREGKRRDMPPGFSQCDFSTPPQMYVKRRFDNPPLPEAAGFSSVTITTNPTTAATFAESRRLVQADAEDVSGIGDAAYLYGPAMIYVRVGNRGFSVRLHVNAPTTDAGKARLRAVMLSLARAGVAKL